jgi:uncharacterized protein (TIGR03437 family)
MQSTRKVRFAKVAIIAFVPVVIYAFREGPPPRKTGAPGDSTCLDCHIGPRIDNSASLDVTFPNGLTYTPGVQQKLAVHVNVAGVEAWGFEMTARLASNASNAQAGSFSPVDGNTQVICQNGSPRPSGGCSASAPLEFIEHTLAGTQIYVAANASTGPAPAGAKIHLKHYTLAPAAATPNAPAINVQNGVVNGASFQPGISAGSWGTILGTNLSTTTRAWATSDFVNGTGLPASLDGVSVLIDGKAAYVEFVSPTQINFVAPASDSLGPVSVQVKNKAGTSNTATAQLHSESPAFFLWNNKYAAASHTDFSLAASPSVFSGAKSAEPGETIILWGTGFGATNPAADPGQLTSGAPSVVTLPVVTIGGVQAEVFGAALSPGFAGLYQVAVEVPKSLSDGDHAIVAQVNGVQSAANVFLTVQRQ